MNYFYQPEISNEGHLLDGEEFIHCTKVLRNKQGDRIGILDGKGGFYTVEIGSISGKKCDFRILEESRKSAKKFHHHIAIAPTKNIDRTEWFVEKACELGVDEISFILTKNSERTKLRIDRLEKKALSALKQSKSGYLTQINELIKFPKFIESVSNIQCAKYIAYVESELPYYTDSLQPDKTILTLIGPEGDFNPTEVQLALENGFEKISLGSNTLRTETAGLASCQFVNFINRY
ncbi:MAG: 16S rRNA (uracil(1498)-N(3))-methyltransferase [Cyclobacteriaceae bacterium]